MSVLIVKSDWEDVYVVEEVKDDLWAEELFEDLRGGLTLYRTSARSNREIRGYFVKTSVKEGDAWCCGVYRVSRSLYQGWKWEILRGRTLEYDADKKQCRLSEEIDIKATRKIIDDHTLWGNAIEIVKNLRDGCGHRADASYKDLCLRGILFHFQILDKHLGLLPADSCPGYKEVLHSLKHEEDSDDESEESEESDDGQETCAGCEKVIDFGKEVHTSDGTFLCPACWT